MHQNSQIISMIRWVNNNVLLLFYFMYLEFLPSVSHSLRNSTSSSFFFLLKDKEDGKNIVLLYSIQTAHLVSTWHDRSLIKKS